MNTLKPRHKLSNVDLEHRTATCSICGDTNIYVYKNPRLPRTQVKCFNKVRENNLATQQRFREKKRLQNPNRKPLHKVREIDLETMSGICAVCGPTEVLRRTVNKKYTVYLCATKARAYGRAHYIPRSRIYKPSFMALARQDQQQIIEKHKVACGCTRCGYKANPYELELHFRDLPEREFSDSKLVHFSRRRLLHALRICEVYCANCHALIHGEPSLHKEILPIQKAVTAVTLSSMGLFEFP
jgi:hypothetical protein